jgi:hypothetical protein
LDDSAVHANLTSIRTRLSLFHAIVERVLGG